MRAPFLSTFCEGNWGELGILSRFFGVEKKSDMPRHEEILLNIKTLSNLDLYFWLLGLNFQYFAAVAKWLLKISKLNLKIGFDAEVEDLEKWAFGPLWSTVL